MIFVRTWNKFIEYESFLEKQSRENRETWMMKHQLCYMFYLILDLTDICSFHVHAFLIRFTLHVIDHLMIYSKKKNKKKIGKSRVSSMLCRVDMRTDCAKIKNTWRKIERKNRSHRMKTTKNQPQTRKTGVMIVFTRFFAKYDQMSNTYSKKNRD